MDQCERVLAKAYHPIFISHGNNIVTPFGFIISCNNVTSYTIGMAPEGQNHNTVRVQFEA